jgi:hypothetical protein
MLSDPVTGNKFFGRNSTLELIGKRVNGLKDGYRQNIAIVGPKLIGKSSLILHFFSGFSHHKIIPIYVDLKTNSFNHFIYKFLGTLLYGYLKNKGLESAEDLELLKIRAQKNIPKTVETIQSIQQYIKNLQFDKAYKTLLHVTAILKQESSISSILILDEFHLLRTYNIKDPFLSLAKEIMLQKDTMYIFISSQISYARKILCNELSLLFGNFEVIYLKPFDYITCCKFLEKRFQDIILPSNIRDFLIAFTEGHPFCLDILSNKLREKVKELNKTEVTRNLISQAFNSLLYDSKGIINQYLTNFLSHNLNGADYSNFMPVLLSVSSRARHLNEISKIIKRQPKILARQIGFLLEKDLLAKVGIFYVIPDKIFRFWLRSVYKRKNLSLISDPVIESKNFAKEIEEEILKFSNEAKRKLIERVVELFQSFRNEIVVIQNKSVKLRHFEEISFWPKQELQDCIICRYKDGYWACLIKEEGINETQIQDFFYFCKNAKYKIRKLIIISLKDLDLNARLIALEKKIWIWSLVDLNLILDLFGKQQIVN